MRDLSRLYRLVMQLYPPDVRDRYGRELLAMLADSPRPWRDVLDVIHCALNDRMELLLMTYLAQSRPFSPPSACLRSATRSTTSRTA